MIIFNIARTNENERLLKDKRYTNGNKLMGGKQRCAAQNTSSVDGGRGPKEKITIQLNYYCYSVFMFIVA